MKGELKECTNCEARRAYEAKNLMKGELKVSWTHTPAAVALVESHEGRIERRSLAGLVLSGFTRIS